MNIWKAQDIIVKLLYLFFFWMIWQFLAHTVVMYGLQLPESFEFIRLWKEVIIWILWIWSMYIFRTHKEYKDKILQNKNILLIISIIIGSFVISLLNSIIIHDQSIVTFLVSAKFNYIPLIILSCGLLVSQIITSEQYKKIITIIITTIKYVLIFSIIWYAILHTIPNILDRIGFAQPGDSIERTTNTPPPSLYLTEFYSWYVRNQWPFWWPLSLGFYLIWLWPLFFAKVLYKKKLSDTRWRRLLYISMVVSTYSRAAWWMFFVSCVLIGLIIYRKYTKYIIWIWMLSVILLFVYLKSWGTSEMFVRTRSDKWHLEYFQQGLNLVKQYWLRWLWASSVWPWSNHVEWITKVFNPENQYMQIWLEYGLLWLLWRLFSYILIIKNSIIQWYHTRTTQRNYNSDDIIFMGIGISIVWLSIWGMVLHPFTDSSSMYPFMLFAGLVIGKYSFEKLWDNNIIDATIKDSTILSWRKIRSILIGSLFTIQTILVSWFEVINNTIIISTIRDIVFGVVLIWTVWYQKTHLISFIKKYYVIIALSSILFMTNIIYLIQHLKEDIIEIIAWIKYDIYFLIILIAWIRIWHITKKTKRWHLVSSYIKRLWKFIIVLVIWWVIRQIIKTIYPEFFVQYIWFSMPSDFVPFSKPPIYYITWSGWIQRLSWFFVGPNTLWFFLILFTSSIYYKYKSILLQKKNRRIILLYILISMSTLSRWVIIGLTIQCIILVFFENYITGKEKIISFKNIYHKIIIWAIITLVSIVSFFWINQRKQDSNTERFWAVNSSLELAKNFSFFGDGPWYVWPAKHYNKDYNLNKKNNLSMLENIYLQIIINQGILWFLIFVSIVITLLQYHNTIRKKINTKKIIPMQKDYDIYWIIQYLWIGLLSLLAIWWFLHIFIDSMANYLFFVIYGIGIWYTISDHYE